MPSMKVSSGPARGRRLQRGVEILREQDPLLGPVIARSGACRIEGRRDPFVSLAEAIVYQQLSMKAAATIWKRLESLFDRRKVEPEALLRIDARRLRRAGLSRQKVRYLRDLAQHFRGGALTVRDLGRRSDEEVIETLTQVKGVGRWTAEMFLIFCLKRPDVWPVDDLGILKGLQRLFRMRRLPDRKKALAIGERWRPYRTVATWYLWRGLDGGGIG